MPDLGRPAIPGVRALSIREVQTAIDRIRERFANVDALLATTTAQSGQSTLVVSQANASISNLQRQLSALVSRVDALSTDTETQTFVADTAIEKYDPVLMSSLTGVSPAVPGDGLARYGVIGVATEAASPGANVVVRLRGVLQITTAVFEPGGPIYVGLDGLTQYPEYVGVAIPVGVAVSVDRIEVAPGWPALQYPGVYSEFETFLPATWGLVRDAVELSSLLLSLGQGIVVKTGASAVVSRTLVAGSNITIANPDGVDGNPVIASTASGGGDSVLYDSTGRALLTADGRALLVGD